MVRQALNVQVPTNGLNTELSDLQDAPAYSKDELNMDILPDGSRARRLGLEYETGYKFTNSSLDDPYIGDNYQSTKMKRACNAYEWTNYDGEGHSIIVMQTGRYIRLFNGIHYGKALSDEESSTVIDLKDYAVTTGTTVYTTASQKKVYAYSDKKDNVFKYMQWPIYADEDLRTVLSTSQDFPVDGMTTYENGYRAFWSDGEKPEFVKPGVYRYKLYGATKYDYATEETLTEQNRKTVKIFNSLNDEVYTSNLLVKCTLSNGTYFTDSKDTFMYYNRTRSGDPSGYTFTMNDMSFANSDVSFTSGYGKLFISGPMIDVIMVEYNKEFKYTQSTSASVALTVSFNSTGRTGFAWRKHTGLIIKDKNGNEVFNYNPYGTYVITGGDQKTGIPVLVDALNSRLLALGLSFSVTSNENNTLYVNAPSGEEYNGYTVTWNADYVSHGGSHYRNHYGVKSYYTYDDGYPSVSGVMSGATTSGRKIPEGLRHSKVTPKVRDTQGLQQIYNEDGSVTTEISNEIQPTELTDLHKYNLLNQGWDLEKINQFHTTNGYYPSNALTWFALKGADGKYAPATITDHAFGTSLAPRGKFILNAYEMDRDAKSNIPSIPDSVHRDERPEDVTFYAGRLWYALGTRLLYSQIITEDASLVDRCYQSADPTSEEVSDPIDTDGGVINLHQCGKILRVVSLGPSIIAFGNKAIMCVQPGSDSGFTPTSYIQRVVSNIGTSSKRSIVVASDAVYYWSQLGIYRLGYNESGELSLDNISYSTIQSYFKNIPEFAMNNCVAKINAVKNEISFMYPTNEGCPRQLNKILKYNVADQTWTPRDVPLTSFQSPFIVGAIELKDAIDTKPKAIVEVKGESLYADGEVVSIGKKDYNTIGFDSLSYLVIHGETMKLTFANCTNIEHKDWATGDILGDGYEFKSYITTHPYVFNDIHQHKQAPYVITTMRRTEEGDLFHSGCFMSARWDWSEYEDSFKWDSKQQIYRPSEYYKHKKYIETKTRVRGSGKSLQLHFESDGNKDFILSSIGIEARGWNK